MKASRGTPDRANAYYDEQYDLYYSDDYQHQETAHYSANDRQQQRPPLHMYGSPSPAPASKYSSKIEAYNNNESEYGGYRNSALPKSPLQTGVAITRSYIDHLTSKKSSLLQKKKSVYGDVLKQDKDVSSKIPMGGLSSSHHTPPPPPTNPEVALYGSKSSANRRRYPDSNYEYSSSRYAEHQQSASSSSSHYNSKSNERRQTPVSNDYAHDVYKGADRSSGGKPPRSSERRPRNATISNSPLPSVRERQRMFQGQQEQKQRYYQQRVVSRGSSAENGNHHDELNDHPPRKDRREVAFDDYEHVDEYNKANKQTSSLRSPYASSDYKENISELSNGAERKSKKSSKSKSKDRSSSKSKSKSKSKSESKSKSKSKKSSKSDSKSKSRRKESNHREDDDSQPKKSKSKSKSKSDSPYQDDYRSPSSPRKRSNSGGEEYFRFESPPKKSNNAREKYTYEDSDFDSPRGIKKERRRNKQGLKTELKEKIFGDSPPKRKKYPTAPKRCDIFARKQHRFTVSRVRNSSEKWIVSINTNKGDCNADNLLSSMKAFEYNSREEAEAAGLAFAPPKMITREKVSRCFLCQGKFAMLRRAHHCRNCGQCVCSSCSVTWPSKMVPDTFNFKRESTVRVCDTCDWVKESFRRALLKGKLDEVKDVYDCGNVNLRCTFATSKGESKYPVHCAAESGNLDLLKWLVEKHYCPLFSNNQLLSKDDIDDDDGVARPLMTSKGRSVLAVAMQYQFVDMIRYLVVDKGLSVFEIKCLRTLQCVLDQGLRFVPPEACAGGKRCYDMQKQSGSRRLQIEDDGDKSVSSAESESSVESAKSDDIRSPSRTAEHRVRSDSVDDVNNDCRICFQKQVECVLAPCGHQVCCMECGERVTTCPICSQNCYAIKTFKAF